MSQLSPISNTGGELEEVQALNMIAPLIFKLPRHEPDMLIEVFHRPFHVHSIILRLHCGFFAKFLDSPDKKASPANSKFRYHYVAVIDIDGTGWGLQTADSAMPLKRNKQKFARFRLEDEEVDFEEFLKAMYGHEYIFQYDKQTLLNLVKYADYYDALQWLSLTLGGALMRAPDLSYNLQENAGEILLCAKKLRHATLFRECFVHVVGFWNLNIPKFETQIRIVCEDSDVTALVEQAQARISQILMAINHCLYIFSGHCLVAQENIIEIEETKALQELLTSASLQLMPDDDSLSQAWYYRTLSEKLSGRKDQRSRSLYIKLNSLLRSNLRLDGGRCMAGSGEYAHNFLCAEISDEGLPWVPFETSSY